jgi:hypothetical protein
MSKLDLSAESRRDIAESINMKICFIETGNPKLRRNDAIDDKQLSCIKKTTLENDRFIVTMSDFIQKLERSSPGRAIEVEGNVISGIEESVQFRIAFIETGSTLRKHEVERFNNSAGNDRASKMRPLHALTSTQEELIRRLEAIQGKLNEISFGIEAQSSRGNLMLRR